MRLFLLCSKIHQAQTSGHVQIQARQLAAAFGRGHRCRADQQHSRRFTGKARNDALPMSTGDRQLVPVRRITDLSLVGRDSSALRNWVGNFIAIISH